MKGENISIFTLREHQNSFRICSAVNGRLDILEFGLVLSAVQKVALREGLIPRPSSPIFPSVEHILIAKPSW